jgi:hypothetical protein
LSIIFLIVGIIKIRPRYNWVLFTICLEIISLMIVLILLIWIATKIEFLIRRINLWLINNLLFCWIRSILSWDLLALISRSYSTIYIWWSKIHILRMRVLHFVLKYITILALARWFPSLWLLRLNEELLFSFNSWLF